MAEHDVVIRGGMVIDGTEAPQPGADAEGNLDGTRELLTHPFTVPALPAGGRRIVPRADGGAQAESQAR